ncbi:hypothetical protein D5R81_05785 [Parashewanella spongiae]|uniref:GNAT family N-acetyltransferase n=1 Tax=Parashewanella spongiae TaxID=342950 RepID=A0A3A6TYV1_9GAMM|nr:hypothetical protein [Parashewanella spongiae]MCL1077341.1 hypothetical protein [Parashewanella spongiae]RJY18308.1 hypothetical protein D5R81_05785 [Parashewanella spongiae]
MPNIELRQAEEKDWPFVNLLIQNELKSYLNALWPYEHDKNHFIRLKQARFGQETSEIISLDGVDVGRVTFKKEQDNTEIEDIQLWYDTEHNSLLQQVLVNLIDNHINKGDLLKVRMRHENPLVPVMRMLGFSDYFETDHQVYLRKIT